MLYIPQHSLEERTLVPIGLHLLLARESTQLSNEGKINIGQVYLSDSELDKSSDKYIPGSRFHRN